MLDIRYMRKNSAEVKQRLEDRGVNPETIDELLELDQKRRDLIQKVESLKAQRNDVSDKIAFAKRQKESRGRY